MSLRFWLHLIRNYFRIEVEGVENIPRKGGVLVAPNHSGFSGFDAVLLAFVLKRNTRRRARILAHRAFFDFNEHLKALAEKFGLRRASVREGMQVLKRGQVLILFPEGESGNFKPTIRRYRLRPFKTGFLKMAIEARAPIVPCLILGAEESHLNLGNIDLSAFSKNLRIPLPLNLLPLPAKWKIVFLPPILPEELERGDVGDAEDLYKMGHQIRLRMQRELGARLRKRKYVYFKSLRKALKPFL